MAEIDTWTELMEPMLPAIQKEARDYIHRMHTAPRPSDFDEQKMRFAEASLLAAIPSSIEHKPRGAYVPLTEEEVEVWRRFIRKEWAGMSGQGDTLCNMAISSLLYAQEINRLRTMPSAIERAPTDRERSIAEYAKSCPAALTPHDWRHATDAPGWRLGDECVRCQACQLKAIAPPRDGQSDIEHTGQEPK